MVTRGCDFCEALWRQCRERKAKLCSVGCNLESKVGETRDRKRKSAKRKEEEKGKEGGWRKSPAEMLEHRYLSTVRSSRSIHPFKLLLVSSSARLSSLWSHASLWIRLKNRKGGRTARQPRPSRSTAPFLFSLAVGRSVVGLNSTRIDSAIPAEKGEAHRSRSR